MNMKTKPSSKMMWGCAALALLVVILALSTNSYVLLFLIPCVKGRLAEGAPNLLAASTYGSIFPAVWSFQLALRARGLGSTLTTLHLMFEQQIAEILGIPEDVMQVGLLPVGYTKGTDFKPAERPPVSRITHWDMW